MNMQSLYLVVFGLYCTVANKTSPNKTSKHCPLLRNLPPRINLHSLDDNPQALGSIIFFSCQRNYALSGPKEVKCQRHGWSTRKRPRCQALKCPDPGRPDFGRRGGMNFSIGATVSFYCLSGFRLFGSQKRVCQENRKWSGNLTTCDDNSSHCPDPGIPVNSKKTGRKYNQGCVVQYSCKIGYILRGSKTRTCQNNGSWSGVTPVCEDIIPPISVVSQLLRKNFADRLMATTCSSRTSNCSKQKADARGRGFRSRYRDGLDLIFVLDSSSSVTEHYFKLGLELIKEMARMFGIDLSDDGTRIAAVSFGTKPNIEFGFQDHSVSTTARAIARISKIKFQGGATDTRKALDVVRKVVLALARNHSKKAVMFITDGNSNLGRPGPAARRLKSRGVEIYVIGVGRSIRREELRAIASWPHDEHLFRVENRVDIEDLIESLTDYSECGRVNAQRPDSRLRVVGGKYSRSGKWPWALFLEGPQGECTGTLIDKRWALTAAHCIVPSSPLQLWSIDYSASKYEVKLGYTNLTKTRQYHVEVGVQKLFVHDGYLGLPSLLNDIALIKLKPHVGLQKYTKHIQRICLPENFNFTEINDTGGIAIGWGNTEQHSIYDDTSNAVGSNTLKEVFLPFANNTVCKARTVVDYRSYNGWVFDNTTMFCAGNGLGVNDTCLGDSGGPFMVKQYDKSFGVHRWYKVGITSWGVGCASKNEYAYLTKVTAYMDWIKRIMKENTP